MADSMSLDFQIKKDSDEELIPKPDGEEDAVDDCKSVQAFASPATSLAFVKYEYDFIEAKSCLCFQL